jgi:hypothetical protein
MNIDKAIEILQSGLITQQEQSELATFLQTAVLAEREACAKLCESEGHRIDASWESCAAAIRARCEK